MAMTWEDLQEVLNADYKREKSVKHCFDLAIVIVDKYCGTTLVPTVVKEEAYLLVGVELYDRRQPMDNVGQFNETGGIQLRLSRDPIIPALPVLSRWVRHF